MKINDRVEYLGKTGIIQHEENDTLVVRFKDGSLSIFNKQGLPLTSYHKGDLLWADITGQTKVPKKFRH
jgi:hypothetical protein